MSLTCILPQSRVLRSAVNKKKKKDYLCLIDTMIIFRAIEYSSGFAAKIVSRCLPSPKGMFLPQEKTA